MTRKKTRKSQYIFVSVKLLLIADLTGSASIVVLSLEVGIIFSYSLQVFRSPPKNPHCKNKANWGYGTIQRDLYPLLTECAVHTVSYGPSVFLALWLKHKARGPSKRGPITYGTDQANEVMRCLLYGYKCANGLVGNICGPYHNRNSCLCLPFISVLFAVYISRIMKTTLVHLLPMSTELGFVCTGALRKPLLATSMMKVHKRPLVQTATAVTVIVTAF